MLANLKPVTQKIGMNGILKNCSPTEMGQNNFIVYQKNDILYFYVIVFHFYSSAFSDGNKLYATEL